MPFFKFMPNSLATLTAILFKFSSVSTKIGLSGTKPKGCPNAVISRSCWTTFVAYSKSPILKPSFKAPATPVKMSFSAPNFSIISVAVRAEFTLPIFE